MNVIQIEITNACIHQCANCTRFCGHHRKPFFMDFATFKKAVDSLKDFPGIIGIMGGEPTIHPQFPEFVQYLRSTIPPYCPPRNCIPPQENYIEYVIQPPPGKQRLGIWSALGKKYYKYFELIHDTFDCFVLNDHTNDGLHQALLLPRKELGISDEEWIPLRDNCWIQNLWSASITPKGAFFCEVAAALDMLFDGPGGWPIEPGWWRRTPEEFGDQLKWCELCSAPLRVPFARANAEIDIVSPMILEKLKQVGSPKIRKKKYTVFDVSSYRPEDYPLNDDGMVYLEEHDESRRIQQSLSLTPREIQVASIDFDQPEVHIDLQHDIHDWMLLVRREVSLHPQLLAKLKSMVLNPGCLYLHHPHQRAILSENASQKEPHKANFLLFNRRAQALQNLETIRSLSQLIDLYSHKKRFYLDDSLLRQEKRESSISCASHEAEKERLKSQLMSAHLLNLWQAIALPEKKVALYPGGKHSRFLLQLLEKHHLPLPELIIDDHADNRFAVLPTDERIQSIHTVFISSDTIHEQLYRKATSLWPQKEIIDPYMFFSSPTFNKG